MVIEILNEYDSELVSLIRESFSENVETNYCPVFFCQRFGDDRTGMIKKAPSEDGAFS